MTAGMRNEQSGRAYFPHVEGLRGIAALYVFLYHMWQVGIAHAGATLGMLLPFTLPWLQFGHYAVTVFIVISGYCLGLPVALRPDRPFSVAAFARRRARRLGPAYVLALFLSLIPFYAVLALKGQHVAGWHVPVALIAHLALVHNLIPSLAEYLNGPMWSIALECQIYVVFALLLVPVWRRFGPWTQLAIALVIGLTPQLFFHGALAYAAPWLLGLFGIGFVAAHVTARGVGLPRGFRWIALAGGLAAIAAVLPLGDAAADGALFPYTLVVLERGAQCTVLERIEGGAPFVAGITQIVTAENALLTFAAEQSLSQDTQAFFTRVASPGKDSAVTLCLADLGAALAVTAVNVVIGAPGADAHLNAFFFPRENQHVDLVTTILHDVGESQSQTLIKSAATGRGQARYLGNIFLSAIGRVGPGIPTRDLFPGFRAYSRRFVETIDIAHTSESYFFSFEIIAQARYCGLRICQVPVRCDYKGEHHSMKLSKGGPAILHTCRTVLLYRLAQLNIRRGIFAALTRPGA